MNEHMHEWMNGMMVGRSRYETRATKPISGKQYMRATAVSECSNDEYDAAKLLARTSVDRREQSRRSEEERRLWQKRRQKRRQKLQQQQQLSISGQYGESSSRGNDADDGKKFTMHTQADELGHFAQATEGTQHQHDKEEATAVDRRESLHLEHEKWEERRRNNLLETKGR